MFSPESKIQKNTLVATPTTDTHVETPIAIDSTTLIKLIKKITDRIYQLNNSDVVDDEYTPYIVKALSNVSSNDNSLSEFLKNSNKTPDQIVEINLLLNYLKEIGIAAFGTPHDFHTKTYTKLILERCKNHYYTIFPDHTNLFDELFSYINGDLEKAYKTEKTEKLAIIWKDIELTIKDFILSKYNVQIPSKFVYEIKSSSNNDDDDDDEKETMEIDTKDDANKDGDTKDGRIGIALSKMNADNASNKYLCIDTAHKAMLNEFANLGGKGVELRRTVCDIDGANQPKMRDGFYENIHFDNQIDIGDIRYSRDDSDSELPILISLYKDKRYIPVMRCQTEAGVTIIANLLQLFDKDTSANKNTGAKVRSKKQTKIFQCKLLTGINEYYVEELNGNKLISNDEMITEEFIDFINSDLINSNKQNKVWKKLAKVWKKLAENLKQIIINAKAAGDKGPIDVAKELADKEEHKGNYFWLSTGDNLASIGSSINNTTIYNKPYRKSTLSISPFEITNPYEKIIKKLFILKKSIDEIENESYIEDIGYYIEQLFNLDENESPNKIMARYFLELYDRYKLRFSYTKRIVDDLYDRLLTNLNNNEGEENLKQIIDKMRSKIPDLSLIVTELDKILYVKNEMESDYSYNEDYEKVYDTPKQTKVFEEEIDIDDLNIGSIYKMNTNGLIDLNSQYTDEEYNQLKYKISNNSYKIKNQTKVSNVFPIEEENKTYFWFLYSIYNVNDNFDTQIGYLVDVQDGIIERENEGTENNLPNRDDKYVNEESIIGGNPELNNGKKLKLEVNINVFREVLDKYDIISVLDDVYNWKNNRFIIPDIPSRPSRTFVIEKENTKKFYKHIMAALYYLIKDTELDVDNKIIQEDVYEILLSFISIKTKQKYDKVIDFIDSLFSDSLFNNEMFFQIFDIKFEKGFFVNKIAYMEELAKKLKKLEDERISRNVLLASQSSTGSSYYPPSMRKSNLSNTHSTFGTLSQWSQALVESVGSPKNLSTIFEKSNDDKSLSPIDEKSNDNNGRNNSKKARQPDEIEGSPPIRRLKGDQLIDPMDESKGGSKNITKKHNKKTRKYHRNKKTKKTHSRKKRYSKKNKYRNKST